MVATGNAGRIGIWGRSGSGKSTYCKALLRDRARVVALDPLAEYAALPGWRVCRSVDHVRRAIMAGWSKGYRLAYVPPSGAEIDALHALSRLLLAAQQPYQRGAWPHEVTLVVEEMNLSFPVAAIPRDKMGFGEICSRGRHYGIEAIGVSQRIAEVATRFRGNCTTTVVFAQQGPRDLRAAADALGFVAPSDIQRLTDHEFIRAERGQVTRGKNRLGR